MKHTPRKKESNNHKEDEPLLGPLNGPTFEAPLPKNQFSYLNPATGYELHRSLIGAKFISPVVTPKDPRLAIPLESVFKSPNSRGMPSVEKKSNGLGTPDSRLANQQT